MKCDIDGCEREATVHLTEIVNDTITKLHLCEEHAKQKGTEMEQHFGIADLLQGLAEYAQPAAVQQAPVKKLKCSNCGMLYDDFRKIGRLGCAECFTSFKGHLANLLRRIHGSTRHQGKTVAVPPKAEVPFPQSAKISKIKALPRAGGDVELLKAELRKAIETEAYEEAARLRDKIRLLEAKGKGEYV